jgi:transposase
MLNQEDYVNIRELKRNGWTITEIAAETGHHPQTIKKWLNAESPPARRVAADAELVMNAKWRERIGALLDAHPRLLSISIHNKLASEGFDGSYPTVVRAVRDRRGPRFRTSAAASVPIHTEPGEESQFDFCNLDDWAQRWGWSHPLRCFGAILCWSRYRLWWFTTSEDRNHTFEGLNQFFDACGGVTAILRTDRMGALGSSQGQRFVLHPPTIAFAAHSGTKITSCKARDAKRKGKVERPFRQLQETFLPEIELDGVPADVTELNARAGVWLDQRVHAVASRTTGAPPAERLVHERQFLSTLPQVPFDTDNVETRRVHNIVPLVSVGGVRYSVPPKFRGQLVEIRRSVDADCFNISAGGRVIATHVLAKGAETEVWDAAHHSAAVADATAPPRPHLRLVPERTGVIDARDVEPSRLDITCGDFDVAVPDLAARYGEVQS